MRASVVRIEPQAPQLIVGRVLEHRLQRAARHRLAGVDELERARDRRQRQIEARCRAGRAAGVERHHAALDVDDRRARRAARSAGRGLVIEGIEIVVLAVAVFRRLAIQARQRAGENRQLLAGIVADHADFAADHRARRIQRQFRRLDEAQLRRVVAIDAEIVHRIAVHRDRAALPRGSGKMACAVTGPGVTTWRLVRMRPRLASMTNPVACAVVFHSVSNARVLSIWIVTTPEAMRSSVCAQLARLPPVRRRRGDCNGGDRGVGGAGRRRGRGAAAQTANRQQEGRYGACRSYVNETSVPVIGQDQEPHGS